MKKRALILALASSPSSWPSGGRRGRRVRRAKSSTASFHDLDKAIAAGYSVRVSDLAGIDCIAQPGEGAMGVHMLNPSLARLDDRRGRARAARLRAAQRRHAQARRARVPRAQRRLAGAAKPALFGKEFDETRPATAMGCRILRAARVDLEAEPERDPLRLEPARRLLVTLGYAAAGASAPVAASCLPNRTGLSNT